MSDLLTILNREPEGKYLHALEDENLPQVSDALMMMAQFNAALIAFRARYYQSVEVGYERYWITKELLAAWDSEETQDENDEDHQ